uniref:Uncharacterized protein n=1 Tax=Picocystis salinarum TaxID=88271 RepID=A0A7S3UGM8_9CHLO
MWWNSARTWTCRGSSWTRFVRGLSQDALEASLERPLRGRSVYMETYGCQMNASDSEIVLGILSKAGMRREEEIKQADVILVNTCAIRENAEAKIWQRLGYFKSLKRKKIGQKPLVGVLGCMAERLQKKLIDSDKLVDLVVGPDAYRDLPKLIEGIQGTGEGLQRKTAMNVQLSLEETYADVTPVRNAGDISAYLSIMRGCNNMCAFCIVPFTRGRERSRDVASIEKEVHTLAEQGVKEVTLLGQNVNSYADFTSASEWANSYPYADGFSSVYKPKREYAVAFAELLDRLADANPEVRFRFTSPHPKDFPDELLHVISSRLNVCSNIHLPAQSGSTRMLEIMKRGHTREAYLRLVDRIRSLIPDVTLSTDMISGFCGETEEDHQQTLSLLHQVEYDQAFLYAYSRREKTYAARHLADDVPEDVKGRRLRECISVFREILTRRNEEEVGRTHLVLVEGTSRKDASMFTGRTDTNKRVAFPVSDVQLVPGDYAAVQIVSSTAATLRGRALSTASITSFFREATPQPAERPHVASCD